MCLEKAADAVLPHSLPYLDALSRSAAWAATVNLMVDVEAQLVRAREAQLRVVAHAVGTKTTAEARELRERRAREERDSMSPKLRRNRSARRIREPRVFWHEGGDGDVVLLLNGWTASGLVWPSAWLRRLEEYFHVVRVDNRGTGYSRTAPAPFTMADLADDAADVLRAVGAGRCTVLGLSMGGMIAQELALRHPDLVERLILVASRPPSPAHRLGSESVILPLLGGPHRAVPLKAYLRSLWGQFCACGFAEREAALLDELVEQIAGRLTPRSAVINQVRAITGWYGAERLASIAAPTVVVHGAADELSPVANGRMLARLIPRARYIELPDVGHLVPLEARSALENVLLESAFTNDVGRVVSLERRLRA